MSTIATDILLDSIERLPEEKLNNYRPFIVGNDTPLTAKVLTPHKLNQDFILVGTSLMRSVELGCRLAESETIIPKIIIVDNSKHTSAAWKRLKEFFETTSLDAKSVLEDDDGLLEYIHTMDVPIKTDEYDFKFLKLLFSDYDLDYIKKIIKEVVVIEQDWENTEIFSNIREIYHDIPIVAYSSNIIDFVRPPSQEMVLRSIHALQPCLSLCTNYDTKARKPTKSYVFTDTTPLLVAESMDLDKVTIGSLKKAVELNDDIPKEAVKKFGTAIK